MAEWARREVPALIDAGRGKSATDRFLDHWRSAGGTNARKRDWVAAWRNWMRRADEDLARPSGRSFTSRPPYKNPDDQSAYDKDLRDA